MMETERLILRRYISVDLQDLYEYLSDAEVVRYEPYKPMIFEEARQELEYRISSSEFIAVELKETHKMIGNIYLAERDFDALEIGYVFNKKYWKKGYAAEACSGIIRDAFDRSVHRIYAKCDPGNTNSWRLLERLGFIREGYYKQNAYFWKDENNQPIWKDTYVYSLLNS
jgi:RimJ/RimL family protein N-acetyltransferase